MKTYWYIMRVLPGKERQMTEHLNEKIELGKILGIKRFVCPMEKEFVMLRKKKILRDKVIYSGYIYFETEEKLSEDDLKHLSLLENIMSMSGSKMPVLMTQSDIDKIIKDDELSNRVNHQMGLYKIGENVQIVEGPFATFNGIIKEINDDKVVLNIVVFGRQTKVTLNNNQIKNY